MRAMLCPWRDARVIAERLRQPGARLVIALGAESWCGKCRTLRPHFDRLVAVASDSETWLWLDLEDHAEFIGDYIPNDLPQLIVYDGPTLVQCQTLTTAFEAPKAELADDLDVDPRHLSGIRLNLMQEDWGT